MPVFARVDHLIIAVRELDAAARAYGAMLGLAPSWRGTHPTHGTENVIFGLSNCYLELLALGPGQATSPVALALEAYLARKPEGLFAIALGTDDVASAFAHLQHAGLTPTPISDGDARGSDGTTRRWRSFLIPREVARGVNVLVIEHTSAAPAASQPLPGSTSSVTGVDHVVLFSDDLASGLALWRDTFAIGERWQREIPERGTLNVGLKVGGVTIELVAPLGNSAGERGERLWGAAYAVPDCDAAVARLRAAAVPISDARPGLAPRTRIATVKWADRIPTLLLQHLARS